jgi:hypothetical protein
MFYGQHVPEVITVPAGTYYIGDPCYPLGNSPIYEVVWNEAGYATPAFYRSPKGIVYIDSTAHGDGGYRGSDGFVYGVDAGVISIISAEVIQEWLKQKGETKPIESTIYGGKLHTFLHPVQCIFNDGEFEFQDMKGHDILRINTRGDDNDEEEEEDEEEEDMKKDKEESEEDEEQPQPTK